jgi:DNA-binding XRE family transcriptional regulator
MNGKTLRTIRVSKNMTQAEFAAWLGSVKRPTVTAWEQDTNPIPQWVVDKLDQGPKLNPKLEASTVLKAMEQAKAKGQTFDEWVADVISKAVMAAVLYGAFQLFA